MIKSSLVSSAFLAAVGLTAAGYVGAQQCGLEIRPTIAKTETVVNEVSARASEKNSGRLYIATLTKGVPYFEDLSEGEYLITVKKPGFKTTVDAFTLACDGAKNGVVTANFSLWKGSSLETVDLTKTPDSKFVRVGVADVDSKDTASPSASVAPPPASAPVGAQTISGDVLNGKATSLPRPETPPAARAVHAAGPVNVQVVLDENGNVESASAVSGHPLLRAAAVEAARKAKFSPTLLSGVPVKVSGVIVYNFQ